MIESLYKDKKYCFQEIVEARKIFSKKTYTKEEYEALSKGLGLMYLYCPEDIQDIVLATIQEAETRYHMLAFGFMF